MYAVFNLKIYGTPSDQVLAMMTVIDGFRIALNFKRQAVSGYVRFKSR
jgi:hypothetical protein